MTGLFKFQDGAGTALRILSIALAFHIAYQQIDGGRLGEHHLGILLQFHICRIHTAHLIQPCQDGKGIRHPETGCGKEYGRAQSHRLDGCQSNRD